ncbi:MAG: hypothetical protein NW208_09290 [Bryobacter sp.]|nr:hypothetical protein [Bryobacter sp.]
MQPSTLSKLAAAVTPALAFLLTACLGQTQTFTIREVEPLVLPGIADSNSPMHWNDKGNLVVFQSDGMPIRMEGPSLGALGEVRAVRFYSYDNVPLWLEATWKAPNGAIYGWYHHEIFLNCPALPLSMPVIGALVSYDDGKTFFDLGIVMRPAHNPNCNAQNGYFGGGHGDFTVIPDREAKYLYFVFSNYGGPAEQQGIALARMEASAVDFPQGAVFKYFQGDWNSPGLGGEVSPVFGVSTSWDDLNTNALWGPSIHYNEYLNKYVVIMSHACCSPGWPPQGFFLSFAEDLARPETWAQPQFALDYLGWYPMIVGLDPGSTDKHSGKRARIFTSSLSAWEIEFER